MDVLKRIEELRNKRGWTVYKLAERADISDKCIYNWSKRGTVPTIDTIEKICNAFGITLGQFFSEGKMVELTDEQLELYSDWEWLTEQQREAVMAMIKSFKQ